MLGAQSQAADAVAKCDQLTALTITQREQIEELKDETAKLHLLVETQTETIDSLTKQCDILKTELTQSHAK